MDKFGNCHRRGGMRAPTAAARGQRSVCVGLLALSGALPAASIELRILDPAGKALTDSVLAVYPMDRAAPVRAIAVAQMAQREQRFDPHVLITQKGASVEFPNLDRTRHHVYSFSEARSFELKLYLGKAAAPVRFDHPGIVTLGCNIHDWMLGYVVVVDTPYFAQADSTGKVSLQVPDGRYRIWAWHPRLPESGAAIDEVHDLAGSFRRDLQPDLNPAPDLMPPAPLGLPTGAAQ